MLPLLKLIIYSSCFLSQGWAETLPNFHTSGWQGSSKNFDGDNLVTAHSLKEALELAGNQDIFIAGGYGLFKEAIGIVDKMYITEVDIEIEDGDTLFPEFNSEEFDLIEGEVGGDEIKYRRTLYIRKTKVNDNE